MIRSIHLWPVRLLGIALVVVIGVASAGCAGDDNGPGAAAQRFLNAFADHDGGRAGALTDDPVSATSAIDATWKGLSATEMSADTGQVKVTGDTATVATDYTWELPGGRTWEYRATVQMSRSDAGWQVRWVPSNVHPKLGGNQTMQLRTLEAQRAAVRESDGTNVLVPGTVYNVRFDAAVAADSGAVVSTATALATVLGRFAPMSAQAIAEQATGLGGEYSVITLGQRDFDQVRDQLAGLPGVSTVDQADLVPSDPKFAPALLTQVKKEVSKDLEGKAGWRVVSVNPNGLDADVLAETAPAPAPSVQISLSREVQQAAQRAVDQRTDFQVAMVAIQPSTGRILAIAQNELADRDGQIATIGLYPPGSTFKVVTSAAAISTGLAQPSTMVGCPSEVTIGERSVPNYNGFGLGTVPMQTAFARSCNTTFAKLASEMGPSDLTRTAASLGIGPEYHVVGLPTESGSVPIAPELVQRTEDGFGQGKVLTSPFGLAMVAATVARGSTPIPSLIVGRDTTISGPHPDMDPAVVTKLRPMMREVISSGTALRMQDLGEVFGKTGEAEVAAGSHAWFAGYRGDLAWATLVVLGGSSDNAVAVTHEFLAALQPR
ncbi:penicillin-binding transpeptidase domain-containing protein [Williamsia muralis]|uniref:Penicillin-binding transpeptidase domain-containing protein n=1 Tax=Williamsia marianensis TaxID=85044 RepID=A0ABU4EW81_WILMA|nr:penicillin-binding transpeptidase domain-containing protein [Williamsia muralis]MDV7135513.1 penicillin-binding transpeptidase domain-containing protein [Williamsia muralis]